MDPKPPFLVEHVADAPVLRGLGEAELARLLGMAVRSQVSADQRIFARGDAAASAYVVLSGVVRISTLASSGKRVVVEIFQRGELFGEIAAISGGTRTADAEAIGPVDLLAFPAPALRALLEVSAPFARNLLLLVMDRLRRTYSLLEDASLRPLEQRLAKQILYLVKLGSVGREHVRLRARMHQDELADLLGVTTRSIINVLNKWRAEELVSFDGRTAQLTILDMERFRAMLDD